MRSIGAVLIFFICLFAGCTPVVPLEPDAKHVLVSTRLAPLSCHRIAALKGVQRTIRWNQWTDNRRINQGAFNDLRNQAARLGANYVFLQVGRINVDTYPTQDRYNPMKGIAFWCPRKVIEEQKNFAFKGEAAQPVKGGPVVAENPSAHSKG